MKIGCLGRGEGKRGQWLRPVKKFDYNISSKIEEPIKIDLRKESSVAGGFLFPASPDGSQRHRNYSLLCR